MLVIGSHHLMKVMSVISPIISAKQTEYSFQVKSFSTLLFDIINIAVWGGHGSLATPRSAIALRPLTDFCFPLLMGTFY